MPFSLLIILPALEAVTVVGMTTIVTEPDTLVEAPVGEDEVEADDETEVVEVEIEVDWEED